jgi:hypothetical protein
MLNLAEKIKHNLGLAALGFLRTYARRTSN